MQREKNFNDPESWERDGRTISAKRENKCNCEEDSCKEGCIKNHTHKSFQCEYCKPRENKWQDRFDEKYDG